MPCIRSVSETPEINIYVTNSRAVLYLYNGSAVYYVITHITYY